MPDFHLALPAPARKTSTQQIWICQSRMRSMELQCIYIIRKSGIRISDRKFMQRCMPRSQPTPNGARNAPEKSDITKRNGLSCSVSFIAFQIFLDERYKKLLRFRWMISFAQNQTYIPCETGIFKMQNTRIGIGIILCNKVN